MDGLRFIASAIENSASGAILEVEPEMFEGEERDVFDFVRGHLRRHRELPTAQTVQEETGRRLPATREALSYYRDSLIGRYEYNIFRERYAEMRQLISSGNPMQSMPRVRDVVGQLNRSLTHALVGQQRGAVGLGDAVANVMDRLAETQGYGGISGIETGWHGYDLITGGYQDTDLITIVGRMGLGKTYVLLKQAEYSRFTGENVLFVTTEMGDEQIARRHISVSMGINPQRLKTGQISTHTQRRIRSYYETMHAVDNLKIFTVGMRSKVDAIEALCQEFGPTIVYIDGGYLLRPTEGPKNMNRIERITEVFNELKALNNQLRRPIVVTSQFNRQAGKGGKDGTLETVAFSDAIAMNSSLVVALKEGPTENPRDSRLLEFIKGREGEEGSVAINFKFAPLDMSEFTPEQREAGGAATDSNSLDWMQ